MLIIKLVTQQIIYAYVYGMQIESMWLCISCSNKLDNVFVYKQNYFKAVTNMLITLYNLLYAQMSIHMYEGIQRKACILTTWSSHVLISCWCQCQSHIMLVELKKCFRSCKKYTYI